jgi:VanZ family protein
MLVVVAFCPGVGLWDEWRQLSLPGRSAGWDDLLADTAGIALGAWLAGRVTCCNRKGGI